MKKLIFIDACMRAGSRTRRIARPIITELGKRYSVETVGLAKRIAAADRIVIAAPFWDMSFPIALKVFFENMSLYGLCKARKGSRRQ